MISEPELYRVCALKVGLKLYARTKILPGRAWTPSAMLRSAGTITGKVYKRGEYLRAAQDLENFLATV